MHFKEAVGKDDEGNELYEVEAIRDKKNEDGINLYLIKWTGWPEDTNTWEPIENLQDVLSMVEDFNKEFKKDKNKKSVFRNNFVGFKKIMK